MFLAISVGEEMKIDEVMLIAALTACGGDSESSASDFADLPNELVMNTAQTIPT